MTLTIEVERVEYPEVEAMRDLYRQEANCQLICDSALRRGMADVMACFPLVSRAEIRW